MADVLMAFMPVVAFLCGGLGVVAFIAIARKLATPAESTPEQPEGEKR